VPRLPSETWSSVPSNDSPPPFRPVTHDAPLIVPLLPLPEASFAAVPDPSLNA
jgi:hypothetical protein